MYIPACNHCKSPKQNTLCMHFDVFDTQLRWFQYKNKNEKKENYLLKLQKHFTIDKIRKFYSKESITKLKPLENM